MAREKRASDVLRRVAEEHLKYEREMLDATAHLLAAGVHDPHVRFALLESFTIHLRALIDFMWPTGARPDDVIASDFFPTPAAWAEVAPVLPDALEPAKTRVGKEIAHLTYARLDVAKEEKPWSHVEMADAMIAALRVFIESAPEDTIGRLKEAVREPTG